MRSVDSLFASSQSAALNTAAESRCTVKSERAGEEGGVVALASKYRLIKGKYTYLMRVKWSHCDPLQGPQHNAHAALIIDSNTARETQ